MIKREKYIASIREFYNSDLIKIITGIRCCAASPIFVHLNKPIFELEGKSFCAIGLGEIRKKVANITKSFRCVVSYYSTSGLNQNNEFKQVSFDEALKSDIISIHSPLNENTKGLFDEKALSNLKDGATLIDYGRGRIVDETAVAKLIDEREIYFASDVLETEPMKKIIHFWMSKTDTDFSSRLISLELV